MGKGLQKLFNVVVREFNNSLTALWESVSEVSHFISKSRNFSEYARLAAEVKKSWLEATLNEIKNLINNNTFIMEDKSKGYPVTPCINVYKSKIKPYEILDKLRWIIVVIGDLQNNKMIGYTWYPKAPTRTMKYFL